ncbi:MAG: GNAT family N-acetyltransferase [Rhizomicrobium sp.]
MREGAKEPAWSIRAETPDDAAAIGALLDRGFGPGRYAKSAYRLREGVHPVAALSFVAHENGTLRGSVRFWPVAIGQDSNSANALLLGPLAVETAQRGRGIGVALMETGIAAARGAGWPAIVLVGDEPYYARVGFAKLAPGRVRFPGPVDQSRILGLSLTPGALLTLTGEIRRPHLDDVVCAAGAGLAVQ